MMDDEQKESMKRVLMGIKGAARGFKKDNLAARLKPAAPAPEPEAMDPNAPPEAGVDLEGAEPMEAEALEAPVTPDPDAAAKLEAIRKLIGSV